MVIVFRGVKPNRDIYAKPDATRVCRKVAIPRHDPRAHLHQPMSEPQQLSQIPILRAWYPDLRKVIFPHQSQQEPGGLAVELLVLHSLSLDLRGIAHPNLDTQLCQQSLKPSPVPGLQVSGNRGGLNE